ncbi:MAG TPA: TetR/AcrR family transcriptional regulator [Vicinamibacterales bacterium]|nr:TetR/AcrR family transcriptional regulator [Vicinamibacterales bacterium]
MGVRERQEREREAVARAILDAARELFVAEGYQNVSIRKIAEKIEYSPAAIYGYFESKDDIFLALAEEGFRMLFAPGHEMSIPDPIEKIRAGFWRLYTFSKEHPEHFALMFLDRSVPPISKDWERFGFIREMKGRMAAHIESVVKQGLFPSDTKADDVFQILGAAIHGVAVMRLCGRLGPHVDADALARDTLEAALMGLRTGIVHTFHSKPCT